MIQSDLFDRYDLVSLFIPGLVDDSIGTFSDLIYALVLVVSIRWRRIVI